MLPRKFNTASVQALLLRFFVRINIVLSSLQKKLSIYEEDLRILRLTEHKALTGELTGYAHND